MAHPRSRGENGPVDFLMLIPRGLIPAHAGKTRVTLSRAFRVGAHPRSRGENDRPHGAVWATTGSSPLTRGKPSRVCIVISIFRLIPAHAGKTRENKGERGSAWAHPRSRGENQAGRRVGKLQLGSSPLTRGKPRRHTQPTHGNRLIPAHAGKTSTRCGRWIEYRGSSPLTRGKRAG